MAKRQHRFLTVPSGLTLFVCMFLPAIQPCNKPVYPYEMPPVWPPYILGALAVGLALAWPGKPLQDRIGRMLTLTAQIIVWLTCGAVGILSFGTMVMSAQLFPAVPLVVSVAIIFVVGRGPNSDEMSAARVVIATSLIGIAWFGVWLLAEDEELLYGMYVSAGASVALLVSGMEWRRELLRDRDAPLPAATIN